MRRIGMLILIFTLAGCAQTQAPPTSVPTFGAILSQPQSAVPKVESVVSEPTPTRGSLAGSIATPLTQATPNPTKAGSGKDQYRMWMEEARQKHPYQASVDTMWAVMICESSGNPTIQGAGELTGLFQYQPSTWQGAWNPYRDQPITDPHAQIFATAKAWSDGNQAWWAVCLP